MAAALEFSRARGEASDATEKTPAPKVIAAALYDTTERLAHELAQPESAAPEWTEFEWRVARAVAAMHGVSGLLAGSLKWAGPPGWVRFLREQRVHTSARHARIQPLLQAIDERARSARLPLLALKGAELHAMGLYVRGERPMADVDLLVRPWDFKRAARMLQTLGFEPIPKNWRHQVFITRNAPLPGPFGEHADNCLKIELHSRLAETLPLALEDISHRVFPCRPHDGLNRYPSRAALLSHLLLHAAGSMVFRDLRMLHLQDIARLCARMSDADWNDFLQHSREDDGHRWAFPPLQLTARYFHHAIPTRSLTALAAECPPLLRSLARRRKVSDVSLSYLWISAFPGIEWARSPAEMLRYAMSRIRPSEALLEARRRMAETHFVAATSPWQSLSQGRRMWRWLRSRSSRMRTDTIHAVRRAMAQQP